MELDLEELAAVLELLAGADFTEFRLQKGDLNLVVTRRVAAAQVSVAAVAAPVAAATPAAVPAAAPTESPTATAPASAVPSGPAELAADEVAVVAPMLGTFYRSPKPGEPAFLEVGDKVETSTVVGIIEVMKLMSSVMAEVEGEVTRVLASDGQLVEAGQPLFAVRTTR